MIDISRRDEVLWIKLDRPDKLNALTMEGWKQFRTGLDRAAEEAKIVVVTGTDDAFCAGDDISLFESLDSADDVERLSEHIYGVIQGIEEAPVPVIAAVNGVASGGGCEIVAACDLAVADDNAEFSLPETRLGFVPHFAVERMAVIGGRKRIMEMVMTGEPISPETAHEWGLINRVADSGDLEHEVADLVDAILKSPKRALRLSKRLANNRIMERGEFERQVGGNAYLHLSEETTEGVQAFLEGRSPDFQG